MCSLGTDNRGGVGLRPAARRLPQVELGLRDAILWFPDGVRRLGPATRGFRKPSLRFLRANRGFLKAKGRFG